MDLIAQVTTDLPPEKAFEKVCDLPSLEATARARGVEVKRTESANGGLEGTKWFVVANFRGRKRDFELELTESAPPQLQTVKFVTGGLSGTAQTTVQADGRSSVVQMHITLAAQSLTGRLLLQSLKLARGNLERQISKRLASVLNG